MDELLGVIPSAGVELLGLPPIDGVRLIKIDVEGMEKEVIAGARSVVQMFKPIIWSENVAYFSSKGSLEAVGRSWQVKKHTVFTVFTVSPNLPLTPC